MTGKGVKRLVNQLLSRDLGVSRRYNLADLPGSALSCVGPLEVLSEFFSFPAIRCLCAAIPAPSGVIRKLGDPESAFLGFPNTRHRKRKVVAWVRVFV